MRVLDRGLLKVQWLINRRPGTIRLQRIQSRRDHGDESVEITYSWLYGGVVFAHNGSINRGSSGSSGLNTGISRVRQARGFYTAL
jgi:hypothetical protein